jgi:hypothetical protein
LSEFSYKLELYRNSFNLRFWIFRDQLTILDSSEEPNKITFLLAALSLLGEPRTNAPGTHSFVFLDFDLFSVFMYLTNQKIGCGAEFEPTTFGL